MMMMMIHIPIRILPIRRDTSTDDIGRKGKNERTTMMVLSSSSNEEREEIEERRNDDDKKLRGRSSDRRDR